MGMTEVARGLALAAVSMLGALGRDLGPGVGRATVGPGPDSGAAAAPAGRGRRPVARVAQASTAIGARPDPLIEILENGSIDWREGALTALGGAAADLRMPGAASARARAERAARRAAEARLAALLRELPLGRGRHLEAAAVERALARARVESVDYTSNGGATVRLTSRFGDWAEAGPASPGPAAASPARPGGGALALSMPTCRLQAAPSLVFARPAGQAAEPAEETPAAAGASPTRASAEVREARYRLAAALPPGARPLPARLDGQGRIVLADPPRDDATGEVGVAAAAARPVLIYCDKVTR
jgi:hypothetical protein